MKHKFLLTTPEIDAQLDRLQRSIRLSMNGVVADSMQEHGLHYKKNWGVTTLRLREIAREAQPDLALAQRLWLLGVRETMILATLLAPADSFPEATAREWSAECDNQELIEQANMNLFQHLSYAVPFAISCIKDESHHLKSFGFTLALRISNRMTTNERTTVMLEGMQLATQHTDSYLIKTIASCLARFCRIDRDTAELVEKTVFQPIDNENDSLLIIRKFVENELIFLGYRQLNT